MALVLCEGGEVGWGLCVPSPGPGTAPSPGKCPPPSPSAAQARAHLRGDPGGLQDAELKSWGQNTADGSFLQAPPLPSTSPSPHPDPSQQQNLGMQELFGDVVGAGRAGGSSKTAWSVLGGFCQPLERSKVQMLPPGCQPGSCHRSVTEMGCGKGKD